MSEETLSHCGEESFILCKINEENEWDEWMKMCIALEINSMPFRNKIIVRLKTSSVLFKVSYLDNDSKLIIYISLNIF